jgi:hypothetical protein
MKIPPGIYKHFKGHIYRVIGTARHSETLNEYVVYVSVTDPNDMWVRPANMFLELIEKEGQQFPRFQRLVEGSDGS